MQVSKKTLLKLNYFSNFRSETLSHKSISKLIFVALFATNFMSFIGVVQTIKNVDIADSNITEIFKTYNLMQYNINASTPLSYAVMSPYSKWTWFYSFCCTIVIGGSYSIVFVLTVKTVAALKEQRIHMSVKTYSMNKQIHYLLLIQVKI